MQSTTLPIGRKPKNHKKHVKPALESALRALAGDSSRCRARSFRLSPLIWSPVPVSIEYTRARRSGETLGPCQINDLTGEQKCDLASKASGLAPYETPGLVHTTISCLRYGQNRSNEASSSGHLRALAGEGFLYGAPRPNKRTPPAPPRSAGRANAMTEV
jgi:hypothetical protein